VLDQLAQEEEGGVVGDARGLLHVVSDDHDRVSAAQLGDELFDPRRRDGVERRAGLVHQDDLGLDGQATRDAEALLLAPGEARSGAVQDVLHLVPQGRLAQRALDQHVLVGRREPREAQPGQHVLANGHRRKGIGLLEHHAHAPSHADRVDAGTVDVLSVEQHAPRHARPRHDLVHPVDAAHERRLATPRRPDDRGDRPVGHVERNAAQHFGPAEPGVQAGHVHLRDFPGHRRPRVRSNERRPR
jgi:hypothetical protein